MLREAYTNQIIQWPETGYHILADYDAETIRVYQAFNHEIADEAVALGHFGNRFSLERMSWIKPNFLWMMYRCGWATKPNQEAVLAITLKRTVFDAILSQAIHSSYISKIYATEDAWKSAVANSSIRLQWDPDHDPAGARLERRAIQIGLRGEALKAYAYDWIVGIEDITEFVHEQSPYAQFGQWSELMTPKECVYPVAPEIAQKIGLSDHAV